MIESTPESPTPVRVISQAIGEYLGKLGPVWIEGELSEVNVRPGSPMVFMRLRDTSADMSLSIMCHRSVLTQVEPLPQNARVIMHSKVSWYAKNGSLSMSVKEIRKVGVGELLARLEQLKNLLAAEGLFASERKKTLPFLPRKVGLICGRNSAAEKDVIENARRRWPSVEFEIRTVAVQGSAAVIEVSQALRELEDTPEVDVIIITRGGGSFEDLLPFSDESLVRLAASCTTPIVSAIGHEQDSPLLDYVADFRASTPTDAAKRVVPDVAEESERISALRDRAHRKVAMMIEQSQHRLDALLDRPIMRYPLAIVEDRESDIHALQLHNFRMMHHLLTRGEDDLLSMIAQIRTLSPQATLERGYSVVQRETGEIVRSTSQINAGERIMLRFAEGRATAVTE